MTLRVLHCSAFAVRVWQECLGVPADSAQQGESDDCLSGVAGLGEDLFFEFMRRVHFAGGDLAVGSSDKAELTAGEAFTIGYADGWAKDTAGYRTPGVDVTETGLGVEGGTGCVVGEIFEVGLVFFGCAEDAGAGITGEVACVLG